MSLSQRSLREVLIDLKLSNLDLSGNTTEFKTSPKRPDFTNAQVFFVSACEQATSGDIRLVN